MIGRLVVAELRNRPGRAAFLLVGYAFGVAVMVVLLAVGEALLSQARDETLFGGGDVLVIPAGISPELIRSGGATTLFLGLDQARFLHRQILESPRAREEFGILLSSPIIDGKAVEISYRGRTVQTLAAGEIPSRALALGAAPDLLRGSWSDSPRDRQWAYPTPTALRHEIDRFHLPYGSAVGDSTWAEWHYFNVVLDEDRWLYLTYLVGGRIGVPGEWGGQLIATVRQPGTGHTTYTRDIPASGIVLDTTRADLVLDPAATVRLEDGAYHVRASVDDVEVDLRVTPRANRVFPPANLGGPDAPSGYVVPALAAVARGTVCLPSNREQRCETVGEATAYHDHNWGVWRDVAWEWGAASNDEVSLLYGTVRGPGIPDQGLFAYLVDSRGPRGLYRPGAVELRGLRAVAFGDGFVEVPTTLHFSDPRQGLEVEISVTDYQITDMGRPVDRFFLQMRGEAIVREAGRAPLRLLGFFETYVDSR